MGGEGGGAAARSAPSLPGSSVSGLLHGKRGAQVWPVLQFVLIATVLEQGGGTCDQQQ